MTASVRYIVDDVDAAISFYRDQLGFEVDMHPAPGFASLSKGSLRLLLNQPGAGGAGQPMPDGSRPAPGGWNRIQLDVDDLGAMVDPVAWRRLPLPQRDRERPGRAPDPGGGSIGQPGRAVRTYLTAERSGIQFIAPCGGSD